MKATYTMNHFIRSQQGNVSLRIVLAVTALAVLALVGYMLSQRAGSAVPERTAEPTAEEKAAFIFKVPQPGDPVYADYQEMLQEPFYRTSLDNSPGYARPYDPEWRAPILGRREAGPTDLAFMGGATSMEDLAEHLVIAIESDDLEYVGYELMVVRDEFTYILWPEFPQSRPYTGIPADEAWFFHHGKLFSGGKKIVDRLREGSGLGVVAVDPGRRQDYTNFTMYEDVVFTVSNSANAATTDIRLNVVERQDKYKVFVFEN